MTGYTRLDNHHRQRLVQFIRQDLKADVMNKRWGLTGLTCRQMTQTLRLLATYEAIWDFEPDRTETFHVNILVRSDFSSTRPGSFRPAQLPRWR